MCLTFGSLNPQFILFNENRQTSSNKLRETGKVSFFHIFAFLSFIQIVDIHTHKMIHTYIQTYKNNVKRKQINKIQKV
jgi:hypothetical protein